MPYRPNEQENYRDEDWLREKYVNEKLSSKEIADICDCTKPTILNWLDRHGIEKRSKSEAAKIRAKRYPHTTEAGAKALKEHGVNSWELWDDEEREQFREWLSEERTGEDNPMAGRTGPDHPGWKENKPPHRFYQANAWREVRREALEQAEHQCEVCGSVEKLVGHHVVPLSDGGEPLDVDNVAILCRSCHMEWEGLYLRPDTR